jgi:hypothetical protein
MVCAITRFTKVMGFIIKKDLHENVATLALGLATTIITIELTTIIATRPTLTTLTTLELATTITTLAPGLPIHVNLTFDTNIT